MNSLDTQRYKVLRFWLIAAAVVVVIAGLRAADAMLAPFLLSAFIAIVAAPPLLWLQGKGLPSWAALLIVIGAVLAGGILIIMLASDSLDKFLQNLPQYQARLQATGSVLSGWLSQVGIIEDAEQGVFRFLNPQNLLGLTGDMLAKLGGTLTNSFLIFLTTVFMLLEISSFPTKLRAIHGDPLATFGRLDKILEDIQRYMAIKTLISLLTGLLVAIWVALLKVDFPLLWGLLAFLLNYVPNIGSLIAALPAVLLAFVQLGPPAALYTAAGYAVINTVMGNIVEPRMMGRGLDLSSLAVFLSLVFWGWVLGPVGMLLSVPLTMTLKIMLERYEESRWIAVLLGSEEAAKRLLHSREGPPPAS